MTGMDSSRGILRTLLPVASVALLSAAAALFFSAGGRLDARPVAAPALRTVTDVVAVSTPAPAVPHYAAARKVKPLAALEKGDRVLYGASATSPRQRCRWVLWYGSIDFATISCHGHELTVKTGFLTPVEPLGH